MNPAKTFPRLRGFTLVEVLVALFILALIAALGWRGVDGLARARDAGQRSFDRTMRLQTVVAQWEQDLAHVRDFAAVPALRFDGAVLRLTRTVDGGAQVVAWSLFDGVWRRWTSPATTRIGDLQQAWLLSQTLQGAEPGQVELAQGIAGWQLWYYRGAWTNPQSTGDLAAAPAPSASAAAVQREQLPQGVRLMIDLPEGRLVRDVVLPPSP